MKITPTRIPDVCLVEPVVYEDARGFFMETWREDLFRVAGIQARFVQDSHSRSRQGVLRGMHYQIRNTQGKLIRVVAGAIFDVAVDLRRSSPTFGHWVGEVLSAANRRSLWIPPGFAHGFFVLEDAEMLYKLTDVYSPQYERVLLWNDSTVKIDWPVAGATPTILPRDAAGLALDRAECFE